MNYRQYGVARRSGRFVAAAGMVLSRSCGLSCLALALAWVAWSLVPAAAAEPVQFGPEIAFDATGSPVDATNYRLADDGTTITVNGNAWDYYSLDGVISGTGDLVKTGSAVLELSNVANTYSGGTIVLDGVLRIANWNSINPDSLLNAVTGSGAVLSASNLRIGNTGTGALRVDNGGSVVSDSMYLGYEAGSSGLLTVDGTGSRLESSKGFYVGHDGTGNVNVSGGGEVSSGGLGIGVNSGASGAVTVNGASSNVVSTHDIQVGVFGSGLLAISDGGMASGNQVALGLHASSSGTVIVGERSVLQSDYDILVGGNGRGLLAGTGTVIVHDLTTSSVIVNANGTLSAGDRFGQGGTLSIGTTTENSNLTMQNGATIRLDSPDDRIVVSGTANLQSPIAIDFGKLVNLISAEILSAHNVMFGIFSYSLNGVDIGSLGDRVSLTNDVANSGTSLELTATFTAQSEKMRWNSPVDGTWDMVTGNWTNSGGTPVTKFLAGDWVVFDSGGTRTIEVASGGVTASQMDVTAGDWTFTGNIAVADSWFGTNGPPEALNHTLNISGSGTSVTLNGDNYFENGIAVGDRSSLVLKSQRSSGPAAIENDGTVVVDYTGDFVNAVSGSGSVRIEGNRTVVFTGDNKSYSGDTVIESGTLRAGAENAFSAASVHNLSNGGRLYLDDHDQTIGGLAGGGSSRVRLGTARLTVNQSGNEVYGGIISGTGDLTKDGNGTLTLTGANTYTGATRVVGGTLALGENGTLPSRAYLWISGNGTFDISAKTNDVAVSRLHGSGAVVLGNNSLVVNTTSSNSFYGDISDADGHVGGFVKDGNGTLQLASANTYSGKTVIRGGTLVGSEPNSLSANSVHELASGGTLRVNGRLTIGGLASAEANAGIVSLDGVNLTIDFDTDADGSPYEYSGTLTTTVPGGTIIKTGSGTQILSGNALLFTGGYHVDEGVLQVNATGDYEFANVLTGGADGTLAFDLGAAGNQLAFASTVGSEFGGVIQLNRGTVFLSDPYTAAALAGATLRLTSRQPSSTTASLVSDQTLRGLVFDGGSLVILAVTGGLSTGQH
ncbi:MAG: autotransporter-associated beta strand repeat-containing protein [Planctomycetes bacterium]|nr:autotransporter-associated beta strand repeat-containing protein [Planctomycetota bacterium]